MFGRHREKRRGGTTHQPDDDGAAAGMGDMNNNNNNNYEENASEFDGMSSDENPDHDTVNSNANCSSLPDTPSRKMMGFRSMNQRGRRQFQQQQQHQQSSQAASLGDAGTTTGHQGSALRGGGSGCGAAGASAGGSNSRAESVPMRKMVSFDTGGVADQDTAAAAAAASNPPARIRAHSSDELQQEKAETDENLTAAVNHIASFGYNTFDFPMPRQTPTATTKALGYSLTTQSGSQLQSQHLSLHQQQQQPRGETRQQQRERARYSIYHGNSTVKKKFRVRPFHCFPDETVHMTEEDIYTDSLTPSKEFVSLKSYLAPSTASRSTGAAELPDSIRHIWGSPEQDGRIGALRVEVLGCVSLNRTKPDVTVYMVCGDSAFCTDGLTGFRSPMWPSVSRRACVFPIHHAYAKLYVGVFDVRVRKNKENDVFCGRVVIDVASIRPNTEYDTTMPLRASTFVYDKRKRGVIRLRFSLHWFNERAAVVSYFKSVKSLVDSCPLVEGQPTIPCADPKTFRNVAVTVYGQDLPGKYSRNAFRSTMREFNLYQQNLQLLVKVLVLDAMLYEKPWMSFYLFGGAMYCIIFNTVAMVPAFLVGYILILYLENYRHFVEDKDFHLGYKPLTIVEVFMALVLNSTNDKGAKQISLKAIAVEKRTKRRRGQQAAPQRLGRAASKEDLDIGATAEDEENCGEIVPLDHREFPFADRDAYPKFSVEDSLAPGSSKGTLQSVERRVYHG